MTQALNTELETLLRISGADPKKCIKCGKCSGACPAYKEMTYHPHQFVSMVDAGRIDELLKSDAYMHCISCFACEERCPKNVDPARVIEAVRVLAIRKMGENRLKAEDIPPFVDDETPQQVITSAFRKYKK